MVCKDLIKLFLLTTILLSLLPSIIADISAYDFDGDTQCDGDHDDICFFAWECPGAKCCLNNTCDDDNTDGYCTSIEPHWFDDSNYEILNCIGHFGRLYGDNDTRDCENTGCYTTKTIGPDLSTFIVHPFKLYADIARNFNELCIGFEHEVSGETVFDYNFTLNGTDVNLLLPDCNVVGSLGTKEFGVYCGCGGVISADLNSPGWVPDKDNYNVNTLEIQLDLNNHGQVTLSNYIPRGQDYYMAFGDCDDSDASINRFASEVCDAIDNDCDGKIDESLESCYERLYEVTDLGHFVIKAPITFDASSTLCYGGCTSFNWDFDYDTGVDLNGGQDYNTVEWTYYDVGEYDIYLIVESALGVEAHKYLRLTTEQDPFITILAPNGGEYLSNSTFISYRIADPDSNLVNVDFYYDTDTDPAGRIPITNVAVNIDQEFSDSFLWSLAEVPYGDYYVCAVAEADGNTNEDCSDSPFTIGPAGGEGNLPDLAVSDISMSKGVVEQGEKVSLKTSIINLGKRPAREFIVSLFKDTLYGELLDSFTVSALDKNALTEISFSFSTSRMLGLEKLYVMADSALQVEESDENNNHAFVVLRVNPRDMAEREKEQESKEPSEIPELVPGKLVLFYEKFLYVGDVQKIQVYYNSKALPEVLVRVVLPDGAIEEYTTDLLGQARFIVEQEGTYTIIVGSVTETFTVKKKSFWVMVKEILSNPVMGYALLIALIIALALFLAAMYYLKQEREEKEFHKGLPKGTKKK